MQDGAGIQSIARAAMILRAVAARPAGIALPELAASVSLPKSTVHRIVGALAAEDLLENDSVTIRLGPGLTRLGAAARRPLAEVVRPALERLHASLGETVDLAVLDGPAARFVDQIAATHRLRAVSAVGLTFPLHCTANGKAMLAALDDSAALALLPRRLERLTPATITSRPALLAELARVRRDGVAFDREEHTEGISAVGAAVVNAGGGGPPGVVGAISVPVPTARFRGNERAYARAVRAAAVSASQLCAA